jgi:hypothetical protein
MSGLLTAASVMMCPHGGMVAASPSNSNATAAAPILAGSDTCTIAGCTFNISGAPHPCVSVQWVVTATRVQRAGAMVLNASSVGLCLAADQTPQGSVLISSTQASVTGQ